MKLSRDYYYNQYNEYINNKNSITANLDNNIFSNISSAYESSLVCSDDEQIIASLNSMANNEDELNSKVKNVKDKCDSLGYEETATKFSEIYNMNKDFANTYKEIYESVKKASIEAYDELKENYDKEKNSYDNECDTIDTILGNLKNVIDEYDNCSREITKLNNKINSTTDESQKQQLESTKSSLKSANERRLNTMGTYKKSLDEHFETLDSCNANITEYFEKGLKRIKVGAYISSPPAGAGLTTSYLVEK